MTDLVTQFDRLRRPGSDAQASECFSGIQLQDGPRRHLAKDAWGRPAILIGATECQGAGLPASVRLENIQVAHGMLCTIITESESPEEDRFTVIRCLTEDRSIQELFLVVVTPTMARLSAAPTADEVSASVETLVQLFEAIRKPPTGSVQGLWAELFVISRASDTAIAIRSWHSDPSDRFDFAFAGERVEVKSSSDRSRRHYFSLEQAYPPAGTQAVVASVFAEALGTGLSLGDLWSSVRQAARGDAELQIKVEKVCLDVLGATWQEARDCAFDAELASAYLAFYRMTDIPKVCDGLPTGVSEVRFRSDLGLVEPINAASTEARGALLSALLAR